MKCICRNCSKTVETAGELKILNMGECSQVSGDEKTKKNFPLFQEAEAKNIHLW